MKDEVEVKTTNSPRQETEATKSISREFTDSLKTSQNETKPSKKNAGGRVIVSVSYLSCS